jgi:hypothetical protein
MGALLESGPILSGDRSYRGTFRKTGKSIRAAFARFEQYADTAKVAAACAVNR